jgi:hypothetical protein
METKNPATLPHLEHYRCDLGMTILTCKPKNERESNPTCADTSEDFDPQVQPASDPKVLREWVRVYILTRG